MALDINDKYNVVNPLTSYSIYKVSAVIFIFSIEVNLGTLNFDSKVNYYFC